MSDVTLKIYNILGQQVASPLDHRMMEDGTQEVSFDASSLVSGVYLYRISAESVNDDGIVNTYTSIKKIMLIK
ncbi:MAG: T9SS type A sorting domain-containing protein [Bacteroidetes bacterium]|nr:MAG: T9SS type A sorting domain-containing protein [Bacteroidota bacterium]